MKSWEEQAWESLMAPGGECQTVGSVQAEIGAFGGMILTVQVGVALWRWTDCLATRNHGWKEHPQGWGGPMLQRDGASNEVRAAVEVAVAMSAK